MLASYAYDGDGQLVRRDVNGVVTVQIGNYLEYQTGGSTPGLHRYYSFAGRRWAWRTPTNTLHYLQADLVGSTTHSTDATGGQTEDGHYYPFGARRGSGAVSTPYRYTGQRVEGALGLYDYHARWYDPHIRRFLEPDTLVPEPGNPQSYNRYAYGLNNPLKYTDPTGHIAFNEREEAQGIVDRLGEHNVTINQDWGWMYLEQATPSPLGRPAIPVWNEGNWVLAELQAVLEAVTGYAAVLGGRDAFVSVFGHLRITDFGNHENAAYRITRWSVRTTEWLTGEKVYDQEPPFIGLYFGGNRIGLYYHWAQNKAAYTVAHEMGHVVDDLMSRQPSMGIAVAVGENNYASGYSETNNREHWAESAALYVTSPTALDVCHRDYVAQILSSAPYWVRSFR